MNTFAHLGPPIPRDTLDTTAFAIDYMDVSPSLLGKTEAWVRFDGRCHCCRSDFSVILEVDIIAIAVKRASRWTTAGHGPVWIDVDYVPGMLIDLAVSNVMSRLGKSPSLKEFGL